MLKISIDGCPWNLWLIILYFLSSINWREIYIRFAEMVSIGDEVLVQEKYELTASTVIKIYNIQAQGNFGFKVIRNKYCIVNFLSFIIITHM